MPGRKVAKLVVSGVLLLIVIATVFWISDPRAVAAAWARVLSPFIILVLLLLLAGVVMSSLRLQLITADFGFRLTFRDAAMSMSAGQLAGICFFQFAGQLIGRGAILLRCGVPPAATVVISSYERVLALTVSLLLAGTGAIYLFGDFRINLHQGGLSLVKLALGLAATAAAGAVFAWGRAIVDFLRKATWDLFFRVLRSFLVSLVIQATTLAAYVVLGRTLEPDISIASLAAASCIVMLAASLPISFGGWGLRELSAVVALQAIGLPSASALVIAVMIGLMSFAATAGTALVSMVGWNPDGRPRAAVPSSVPDYSAVLDWALPLMAATAVFFQIHIPTGEGRINVNLADPIVLLGAGVFVLHHLGKNWPVWRIAHANAWVAALSAVILLSILKGWTAFGWTDWAIINKGFGWLMLLCYGATGALIIRRAQGRGLDALLRTLVASGVAIVLIELSLIGLRLAGVEAVRGLVEPRISGLSQNPNAFAFMLLLVLAATIVLQVRPAVRAGLMAVALLGLWLTGSRAGLVALPVVLGAALLARVELRPQLITVPVALVGVVCAVAALPFLTHLADVKSALIAIESDPNPSIQQHLKSIVDGLALFLADPVFGAGIGAYMNDQARSVGGPLVIHSTPIWLLAETGVVGLAVFLAAAKRLFHEAIETRREPAGLLLLLILCALAVMSLVHELLFQRAFWLLLGAVLAVPATVSRSSATRELEVAMTREREAALVPIKAAPSRLPVNA